MRSVSVVFLAALVAGALLAAPPGAHAYGPYAMLCGDTLGGPGGSAHEKYMIVPPPPVYTSIELWVWFHPSYDVPGMSAFEFMIEYPPSTEVIRGPVTSNPLNQGELGKLETGMSVSVGEYYCQHDWYWTHWQEIVLKVRKEMQFRIVGHPGNGGHIYVASCDPGFPFYETVILSHFGIYWTNPNSVERSTWGAIKGLYAD